MSVSYPDAWTFVLLALAAFRLYRLIARDTITEPLRAAASYPDDESVTLDGPPRLVVAAADQDRPRSLRVYVSTLLRCPWCMGAYLSVAVWAAWAWQPRWTTFVATPLALSAAVALTEKRLDA